MPELPEVETTRRGIAPAVEHATFCGAEIRESRLRWPVPADLPKHLQQAPLLALERRAKYLLFRFAHGTMLLHLGMSGSLRVVLPATPVGKHDHVDFLLTSGLRLRLRDPRRFGAVLWTSDAPEQHPLLARLGPEPFDARFNANYLYAARGKRRSAVKPWLMDAAIVVGVGNIYANEVLFRTAIRPTRPVQDLSRRDCAALVNAIPLILREAIAAGGSSLRDYVGGDGAHGYFQQQYAVYGRTGQSCAVCASPILEVRLGQRGSFYCPQCQPR